MITGTLPVVCYAAGMTGYLNAKGIRIFDYPEFAKTLRECVRDRAASMAAEAGVTIEHIAKPHVRKEDVVARVLQQRGDHPGLVHIISAMEACDAYKPWHDKQTHKTFIRPDSGKCLHYYFYFQDAQFGLIYLRVPTWAPFRLQFYCNGHSWLARKLTAKGIGYTMADNAFVRIDDWTRAQQLADALSPDQLHRALDRYAAQCCPVSEVFGQSYHWSLMQVEYATDLAFRSTATLGPLYEQLVRQSVLSVKAEQVASFLGRPITPLLAQEIGSQFSTRIEGTCIKHRFGKCAIKMYDKHGIVLRIETTTNNVSFFKHHRKVEHRTGPATRELAPLKYATAHDQMPRGVARPLRSGGKCRRLIRYWQEFINSPSVRCRQGTQPATRGRHEGEQSECRREGCLRPCQCRAAMRRGNRRAPPLRICSAARALRRRDHARDRRRAP